jgi:DNA-binding MarR family transcriptional regulator
MFDDVLEPGGLRATQFVAVASILAEGGPTLPRLARALGVDRSTLTRNLKPLVKAGLVETSTGLGGRTTSARLTPKGEKALQRCLPLWEEAQRRFEARVGTQEWRGLLSGLAAVVAAVPDA